MKKDLAKDSIAEIDSLLGTAISALHTETEQNDGVLIKSALNNEAGKHLHAFLELVGR